MSGRFTPRQVIERIVKDVRASRLMTQDIADEACSSEAVAKETAITLVADQLRGLTLDQIQAVTVFAVHLQIGTVHPFFFRQIADALEGRVGE